MALMFLWRVRMRHMAKGRHSLVEVDSFLGELSRSVLGVLVRLILDHLHALPTLALFMAVFTYHIQLANAVLEDRQETNKQTNKPDIRFLLNQVSLR